MKFHYLIRSANHKLLDKIPIIKIYIRRLNNKAIISISYRIKIESTA